MKNILFSPLTSLIFLVLGTSFFMTFITVRLDNLLVSKSVIGYIHSSYYAGTLLGAIKCDSMINRVGHIRSYAVFASMMTIMAICQGVYINPYLWIIFRFITGISLSGCYLVIESWLLASSTKQTKGKILAIYMACLYASQSISQFFLDIIDSESMQPYMLSAALTCLAIIPSCLTYMKQPQNEPEVTYKLSMIKYFKKAPIGFVGCLIAGIILSSIYSFMPSYALYNNLSVSLLMGIIVAGGFALQWPISKMSDILNHVIVLIINLTLVIILSIIVLFNNSNPIILYIACFFIGGFTFTIYPISIALMSDYFDQKDIVNAIGVSLFAYGVGSIAGSSVTAFLIEISTPVIIFYFIAFSAFILAAYCAYTAYKANSG